MVSVLMKKDASIVIVILVDHIHLAVIKSRVNVNADHMSLEEDATLQNPDTLFH